MALFRPVLCAILFCHAPDDHQQWGEGQYYTFEHAMPGIVVVTTPNSEYNVRFEMLPAGQFRHKDHRFEWTRAQFQEWARGIAERFGYSAGFRPVGNEDPDVGTPTQMGVFARA